MAGPRGELVANVVENNTVTDVEVVVGVVRHITQVGNIGTSAALLKFSDLGALGVRFAASVPGRPPPLPDSHPRGGTV